MAVGVIFNTPGLTREQYELVHQEMAPDNRPSPGMLYHAAGPGADGWRVIEVWESQEALERVFQERLGAAMQRANISGQPEFFEVQNIMQP